MHYLFVMHCLYFKICIVLEIWTPSFKTCIVLEVWNRINKIVVKVGILNNNKIFSFIQLKNWL